MKMNEMSKQTRKMLKCAGDEEEEKAEKSF
jgi:hypothetical protein